MDNMINTTNSNNNKKLLSAKRICILITAVLLICAVLFGVFFFKKTPTDNSNTIDESITENSECEETQVEIPVLEEPKILYEDYEEVFILSSDGHNLSNDTDGSITFELLIPSSEEIINISVHNNRIFLKELSFSESEEGPLKLVDSKEYKSYTFELPTPLFEASSNYVFVSSNNLRSNSVKLFTPIFLTEEDIRTSYNIQCDLAELAEGLLDSTRQQTNAEFLFPAINYLLGCNDVKSFSLQGNNLFYTLTSGEVCLFSASEANDTQSAGGTDSININGSYTEAQQKAESPCDPHDFFTPVQNRNETITTVDPDILVMAPIRSYENQFRGPLKGLLAVNGDEIESLAETIVQKLDYGKVTVSTDNDCTPELIASWDEYGTVFLDTHGVADGGLLTIENRECKMNYFVMVSYSAPRNADFHSFLYTIKPWCHDVTSVNPNEYFWINFDGIKGIFVKHSTDKSRNEVTGSVKISSDYIMYLLENKKLPNTVFLLNSCNSLSDQKFNNFLTNHGASVVWGYNEEINTVTAKKGIKELEDYFLGIEAETEYSMYMNLLSETQNFELLNIKEYLKCSRPSDNVFFTYYGYTKLNGTVTDEITGLPVKKAKLNLYRYYDGKKEYVTSKETDVDGTYVFEKTPYGIYLLECIFGNEHTFVNFSIGTGTEKTVDIKVKEYISISNHEELMAISKNMSGKYYVLNDIVLADQYEPIGRKNNVSFSGVLLGNGHSFLNTSSPLFQSLSKAEIKDLEIVTGKADCTYYAENGGKYGVLACSSNQALISGCKITGSVYGSFSDKIGGNIGGMFGTDSNSIIENCTLSVNVNIQAFQTTTICGGFVGGTEKTNIKNCSNLGNVSVSTQKNENYLLTGLYIVAGGFSGNGNLELTDCFNSGNISSSGGTLVGTRAGGLLGNGDCKATRCYNSGTISSFMPTGNKLGQIDSIMQGSSTVGGKEEADSLRKGIDNINFHFWYDLARGGYAGGFVGSGSCPMLKDCYNIGGVTGSYIAGGIIGNSYQIKAENCINLGSVSGTFCIGGFAGYMQSSDTKLKECYSLGSVESAYICGPFAGVIDVKSMSVENVYFGNNGIDSSLAVISSGCKKHVFTECSGISSITGNDNFDFEKVWHYDLESDTLSFKQN